MSDKIAKTIIEDNEFLSRFGIYIPGKNSFPQIYLKYLPEDFIVEEINSQNEICTIERTNITPDYFESKYIKATLVKKGLRTTEVVEILSKLLGCEMNQIKYMGLKDEDAITAQKISFANIQLEDLLKIKSEVFFLKDFEPTGRHLVIGENAGNRFTIIGRKMPNSNFDVTPKIGVNYFYNYFYTQRFLPPRFANFYWAILLLQEHYEESLHNFLFFCSQYENLEIESMRKKAEQYSGKWTEVKKIFQNEEAYFEREIKVLEYLENNPTDTIGALNQIPEQVKLWIYSISSWFFNHKISSIIKSNRHIPNTLPMYMNQRDADYSMYKEFATNLNIYPPNNKILKAFPFLNFKNNYVKTLGSATVLKFEEKENYIKIVFDLETGSYATSFLAHFFNIISGKIPDGFSTKIIEEVNF